MQNATEIITFSLLSHVGIADFRLYCGGGKLEVQWQSYVTGGIINESWGTGLKMRLKQKRFARMQYANKVTFSALRFLC